MDDCDELKRNNFVRSKSLLILVVITGRSIQINASDRLSQAINFTVVSSHLNFFCTQDMYSGQVYTSTRLWSTLLVILIPLISSMAGQLSDP